MSGGFFRGTSAEQDTRFSNKQAKLLKTQKFAPELEHLVDITKVKMDVIKPWIAKRVTELLEGFEDEVLINFIYGLLEGKRQVVNGKEVQIQLTGFMEKNTGKFMKELWALLISAQKNASGVPQQFLDAKEEETRKKKVETDRIFDEIQRRKEKETKETEQEKERQMDDGLGNNRTEESNRRRERGSGVHSGDENGSDVRNGFRERSRSPKSQSDHSQSPCRTARSRSMSKSNSNSRSYSEERSLSRNISGCPVAKRRSVSPERRHQPPRRSITPRRRSVPESKSPRRRSLSRRRSSSRTPYRSPSPMRRRVRSPPRRRSPSPIRRRSPPVRRSPSRLRRRSPSPLRRRSRSPGRRRSVSPLRRRSPPRRRRSPSPWRRRSPFSGRRRSPSPVRRRRRSTSSPRSRSPFPARRRFQSPVGRSSYPVRRRSPSPDELRSRSPRRHRSPLPRGRRSPSLMKNRSLSPARRRSPVPARRRSPTSSRNRSYSPASLSPESPIRRSSASPVKISPRLQNSPKGSPGERKRSRKPAMMPHRQPITLSPQRDHSNRKHSRRKVPSVSPPPEKSYEDRRLTSPYDSPGVRTGQNVTLNGGRSPSRSRGQRGRHVSPATSEEKQENDREYEDNKIGDKKSACALSGKQRESTDRSASYQHHDGGGGVARKGGNEIRSDEASLKEVHTLKKSPHIGSLSDERSDVVYAGDVSKLNEKGNSQPKDVGGNATSDLVSLHKKGKSPSVDSDSESEESEKHRAEVSEKRKHRKSRRREVASDDTSSESEIEHRKEAKRRKKEEKKLRKEERRRRREERRRKKEEKHASKRKRKSKYADNLSSDMEKNGKGAIGELRTKKYSSDEEETESKKKRLEIELREKALESLRAKKGISR